MNIKLRICAFGLSLKLNIAHIQQLIIYAAERKEYAYAADYAEEAADALAHASGPANAYMSGRGEIYAPEKCAYAADILLNIQRIQQFLLLWEEYTLSVRI